MSINFDVQPSDNVDAKFDSKTEDIEPIFDPANDRINLLPIVYPEFWKFVRDARASYWLADEIDLHDDVLDWDNKLTPHERRFLEANFSLFLLFERIVIKNLETDFVEKITIPEIRAFYRFQEALEDIHENAYNLFPITFVKDPDRLQEINDTVKTFPILGKMTDWCNKWIPKRNESVSGHKNESQKLKEFVTRLVAFVLIEGIIFSGSFAAIVYMEKRGLMPGLGQMNQLIRRDEALHTEFGIAVYKFLRVKLSDSEFIEMLEEIVSLSSEWCLESISVSLIGLNAGTMSQYIKFVANQISIKMISRPVYQDAPNPFPWMEMISLQGKTNFFDRKVTDYSRVSGNTSSQNKIVFDTDF